MIYTEEKKDYNYKHPGRPKGSKGKTKYEDIDIYYQCPECEDGTIDNYSWKCKHCGYSASVYKGNKVDFVATKSKRKGLVRINPWTGDKI